MCDQLVVMWTKEEDEVLREQVKLHGTDKWAKVASNLCGKTSRQCRRRWHMFLNSVNKRGGWSPEEDTLLQESHRKFGNRWTEISKKLQGRTDNAVKNRFCVLCKRKTKETGPVVQQTPEVTCLKSIRETIQEENSPTLEDADIKCGMSAAPKTMWTSGRNKKRPKLVTPQQRPAEATLQALTRLRSSEAPVISSHHRASLKEGPRLWDSVKPAVPMRHEPPEKKYCDWIHVAQKGTGSFIQYPPKENLQLLKGSLSADTCPNRSMSGVAQPIHAVQAHVHPGCPGESTCVQESFHCCTTTAAREEDTALTERRRMASVSPWVNMNVGHKVFLSSPKARTPVEGTREWKEQQDEEMLGKEPWMDSIVEISTNESAHNVLEAALQDWNKAMDATNPGEGIHAWGCTQTAASYPEAEFEAKLEDSSRARFTEEPCKTATRKSKCASATLTGQSRIQRPRNILNLEDYMRVRKELHIKAAAALLPLSSNPHPASHSASSTWGRQTRAGDKKKNKIEGPLLENYNELQAKECGSNREEFAADAPKVHSPTSKMNPPPTLDKAHSPSQLPRGHLVMDCVPIPHFTDSEKEFLLSTLDSTSATCLFSSASQPQPRISKGRNPLIDIRYDTPARSPLSSRLLRQFQISEPSRLA